jgi:lipopolysaccharide biosynthesis regulator YciM
MQDSRIAGAQGAGDVNHRKLGNTSGWGDLPAKQREEALQQIGKDFPSHYRDAIEQYFRKLASENE